MKINMVFADRVARMFLSIAFLVAYFSNLIPQGLALWLSIVSVIFLVTSFTGFCPLYAVLGIGKKRKAA
jgi:hypothetical protein